MAACFAPMLLSEALSSLWFVGVVAASTAAVGASDVPSSERCFTKLLLNTAAPHIAEAVALSS